MYGLGIAKPLRYSYSADLLDLQRLLDGRSVLDNFFSKQSTKGALKAGIGHIPSKLFSKNLQPFKLQVYSKYKKKSNVSLYKHQLYYQWFGASQALGASEPALWR